MSSLILFTLQRNLRNTNMQRTRLLSFLQQLVQVDWLVSYPLLFIHLSCTLDENGLGILPQDPLVGLFPCNMGSLTWGNTGHTDRVKSHTLVSVRAWVEKLVL